MTDSDDFADALRRELTGCAVGHDEERADAVIRTATAADPLGARSWQAPLAAAAVVVVVGGGAAAIAATHSSGGSPSGGGPAVCVSDDPPTTASPATKPSPSTPLAPSTASAPSIASAPPSTSTAVPISTETAAATGTDGPVVISLPPVAGEPARTPQKLQTLAPSTSAALPSAALPSAALPTPTLPGPETTDPTPLPSSSAAAPSDEPCSPTPSPSPPHTPDSTPLPSVDVPTSAAATPSAPQQTFAPGTPGTFTVRLTAQPGEHAVRGLPVELPATMTLDVPAIRITKVGAGSGNVAISLGERAVEIVAVPAIGNEHVSHFQAPLSSTHDEPLNFRLTCDGPVDACDATFTVTGTFRAA